MENYSSPKSPSPYDRGGWEGWSKLRSAASPSRRWCVAPEGYAQKGRKSRKGRKGRKSRKGP